MLKPIDLKMDEPRSAHEELGGVKLLARIVDKGRAVLIGTLGPYQFYDCALDRIFFEAVGASRGEFLEVLRQGYMSQISANADALADLRESLESKPEISDETFMAFAEARDADNAAVGWLLNGRRIPTAVLAAINATVDSLPSEAFIDWTVEPANTRR